MRARVVVGDRFGRLVVTSPAAPRGNHRMWRCVCDCGATKEVYQFNLIRPNTRSCGCARIERLTTHPIGLKHGHARTGKRTAEYEVWQAMVQRCYDKKAIGYARYGGRGIHVCKRWRMSFEFFLADMGPRPTPHHSIERKDNNGGYTPDNCKWIPREHQARNRSTTIPVTINSITLPLYTWAAQNGLAHTTVANRVKRGWSLERACTEPAKK